jgi:predicted signal transduction protein with EAL and GGDEF domain
MDELKIDLNFVRESTSDPEARAIVNNSIALSRDLRVRCVAEGVESVESLRLLSALRCGYAQGYFIGRPMPAGELGGWAAQWARRRVEVRAQLDSVQLARAASPTTSRRARPRARTSRPFARRFVVRSTARRSVR